MKLKFYHLSNDFGKDIKEFIPRVPESRMGSEDNTIPRICVARTIEDCVKAHPSILLYMNAWDVCQRASVEECMANEHVLLEQGISGFLCKLYVFEVDSKDVMFNEELQHRNLVPDANVTNECWITNSIKPIHSEYVLINTANVEYCIDTGDILQEDISYHLFKDKEERGEVMCKLHYSCHSHFIVNELGYEDIWNADFTKEDVQIFSEYLTEHFEMLDAQFRSQNYFQTTEALPF